MKIIDLVKEDENYIQQVATILYEGFKENWPDGWPTFKAALEEVKESFAKGKISRIAIDEENASVLGWIGGIPEREGKVWEIHPLVVDVTKQKQGVGTALLFDFEELVRGQGALTIWIGSDDENLMTSVSGKDLYPNVLQHLLSIENYKDHPFEFYQKNGFVLAGILPDANGRGKPDIYMAKRV